MTNTETEKKEKAIKHYLNRIGIIILQIFFGKEMNEEELIKMGKSEFQIKDSKLMKEYLEKIFWKNLIGQKIEEANLSKLMTGINGIQSQLSQNQYSFQQKIKDIFFQPKLFIDLWNHEIYENYKMGLFYNSQLKSILNKDIPSQKIVRHIDLDINEQIIQSNKDLNNINGTILSFDFNFKYNQNEKELNYLKSIMIEFLKKCSKIQRLNLNFSSNKFTSEELINIFKSIRYCTSLISLQIDIRSCKIPLDSIKEFMLSLQQLVNLKKLNLNFGDNELEIEQAKQIMEGLKNCKLLSDIILYFNHNKICFFQEYNIFSLLQYIPLTYLHLDISSNHFEKRLLNLSDELKKCQLLKVLTLRCSYLKNNDDDSLVYFGNSIKQCSSLFKLELEFWESKNKKTAKFELCRIISNHNLINTIKIDFTSKENDQKNIKSQILEKAFKKKKNFINICVKY